MTRLEGARCDVKTKRANEFFGIVSTGGAVTEWAFDWGFWELRVVVRLEMVSVIDGAPGYICSNVRITGGKAASRRYIEFCKTGQPERGVLALLERLVLDGQDNFLELVDSAPREESLWFRDGETAWIMLDIRVRRLGGIDGTATPFRYGDILTATFAAVSPRISAG